MTDSQGLIDGIGGIFLYSNNPAGLVAWYELHFGLSFMVYEVGKAYGLEFITIDSPDDKVKKSTIFSIQATKETLPEGVRNQHQINLRVLDLDATVAHLASTGITIEKRQDSEYGNFAWLKDADGNRLELFQPV